MRLISLVLYPHSYIPNDVTVGNNSGCETCGFEVQPGWNPVTRLDIVNYKTMLPLFLSMTGLRLVSY